VKSLPPKFLKDNGLLFEINRSVLHPLGLTLQVDGDGKAEVFQTDDPAGMTFTADSFLDGESKLMEYMVREGSSRLASRKAFLRYVVQTDPDQSDPDDRSPPDGSVG
jgi:hypothetical protein